RALQRSNLTIVGAAIANCIGLLVTLRVEGWNLAGLHGAARNTARFSAMCFVFAFAAPWLMRFVRGFPSGTTLIWAWFSAHLVHFASVALLLLSFEQHRFVQHPGKTVLVVIVGFSVVVGAALTSVAHSRIYRVMHTSLLYAIFVIFTVAIARDQIVWLRPLASALVLALALRLTARFKHAKGNSTLPV